MSDATFNRREMLTAAAGLAAVTGLATTANAQTKRVPGVQLYTVRDLMAVDVEKTLQGIAGIATRKSSSRVISREQQRKSAIC